VIHSKVEQRTHSSSTIFLSGVVFLQTAVTAGYLVSAVPLARSIVVNLKSTCGCSSCEVKNELPCEWPFFSHTSVGSFHCVKPNHFFTSFVLWFYHERCVWVVGTKASHQQIPCSILPPRKLSGSVARREVFVSVSAFKPKVKSLDIFFFVVSLNLVWCLKVVAELVHCNVRKSPPVVTVIFLTRASAHYF
jgi:hypothetical protein